MNIAPLKMSLPALVAGSIVLAVGAQETKPTAQLNLPIAPGPFQPTMENGTLDGDSRQ